MLRHGFRYNHRMPGSLKQFALRLGATACASRRMAAACKRPPAVRGLAA
jgi:hypothetical protein